jgi:hypothetical protein
MSRLGRPIRHYVKTGSAGRRPPRGRLKGRGGLGVKAKGLGLSTVDNVKSPFPSLFQT